MIRSQSGWIYIIYIITSIFIITYVSIRPCLLLNALNTWTSVAREALNRSVVVQTQFYGLWFIMNWMQHRLICNHALNAAQIDMLYSTTAWFICNLRLCAPHGHDDTDDKVLIMMPVQMMTMTMMKVLFFALSQWWWWWWWWSGRWWRLITLNVHCCPRQQLLQHMDL